MNDIGKILVILGIAVVILGLLMWGKLGPLGNLPGDVLIERENFKFFFPLTSGIIISLLLSAFIWFFSR